ncbi:MULTISPECIES: Gfo/Idh/MocA family protein [Vibrio]|uniref:Gfo/Idh/MocA family protein n=1 Tax=Vibrio TaxID=662 RepID=UPI0008046B8C|nr:Gfo/Idh/MocA family oxidoreductase [Vibrio natriegens]ANQ19700.1 myo-inositol 2-dehydrogenase [Vibrio natriegens]MEE3877022.1 Gfo/Idh/MocA family oxidoreductase [Vibrio sp. YYF0003]
MKSLSIGMIGTGYMGKAHAIAYRNAGAVFPLSASIKCEFLADINLTQAKVKAEEFGFNRYTDDWQLLVSDPLIDIVDICAPNFLHKDIALLAIKNGKHVYSEKPLALNSEDAKIMTLAAEAAGVKTLVGFNYIKNPTIQLAKQIIENGEIGDVVHFRGTFNEDYLADENTSFSWRLQREFSGTGALGDMGSHIINMAQFLVSPISSLCADMSTIYTTRYEPNDPIPKNVENDDQVHMMVRFKSGAIGTIESSRIAWGRKNSLWFEVTGTKGTIIYDQERLSELKLFTAEDKKSRQGFRTILTGPEHPDYENFCVSAGHGLGYNDMKSVEIRDLIEGITSNSPMYPDFRAAWEVTKVIDAAEVSFKNGIWFTVD